MRLNPVPRVLSLRLVSVALILAAPSMAGAAVDLLDPKFHASGKGDVVTTGSIGANLSEVTIVDPTTWSAGQGVRVARAGGKRLVNDAEGSASLFFSDAAAVTYDAVNPAAGAKAVTCTYAVNGNSNEVMCHGTALTNQNPPPFSTEYDELHVFVRASTAIAQGDLWVELGNQDRSVVQMPLPSIAQPNQWQELYLPVRTLKWYPNENQTIDRVSLRCMKAATCVANFAVSLDDLWMVKDHVTTVAAINGNGNNTLMTLAQPAGLAVTNTPVYHDDVKAIRSWLADTSDVLHTVPAGIYLESYDGLPAPQISPNTIIQCADPTTTVFKSSGGTRTGGRPLLASDPRFLGRLPRNIVIQYCGFDINGYNFGDFNNLIAIYGDEEPSLPGPDKHQPAQNITIRSNRLFDSNYLSNPAAAMQDCDVDMHECATRQRQAILVKFVDTVSVTDNVLVGAGRIKLGQPGRNIEVMRNNIDFVNDNAITVVDKEWSCQYYPFCKTEHVRIERNVIANAVNNGIFFGSDGAASDHPSMELYDVSVRMNTITGFHARGISAPLPSGGAANIHVEENEIVARRPRQLAHGNKAAIGLGREWKPFAQSPTQDVSVRGNRITVDAPDGSYDLAGIYLFGKLDHLRVRDNRIECINCTPGCDTRLHSGIRMGQASSPETCLYLELSNNFVRNACIGINIQVGLGAASIIGNQIFQSTSPEPNVGQLYIGPHSTATIEALIKDNSIAHGQAWGLYCAKGGYHLTSQPTGQLISDNVFDDNAHGHISPWCFQ
jgi:hypothetical protein